MAISYVGGSQITYGNRFNVPLDVPAGVQAGDVLVAFHAYAGGVNPAYTPLEAGWVEVSVSDPLIVTAGGFTLNSQIWIRVAGSSEPATYTWANSGFNNSALLVAYRGVTIIDGWSKNGGAPTNSNRVATGITTAYDGTEVLYVGFDWADSSNNLTPPTGYTERIEQNPLVYAASRSYPTAGATGDITMVCNSGASGNSGRGAWLLGLGDNSGPAPDPQDILASLLSNSATFYSSAVVPGAVGIVGALYSNTNGFFSATVTTAAQILATLFTDGDSFFAGTVSPGVANIIGSLYTDPDSFFSAQIVGGDTPEGSAAPVLLLRRRRR